MGSLTGSGSQDEWSFSSGRSIRHRCPIILSLLQSNHSIKGTPFILGEFFLWGEVFHNKSTRVLASNSVPKAFDKSGISEVCRCWKTNCQGITIWRAGPSPGHLVGKKFRVPATTWPLAPWDACEKRSADCLLVLVAKQQLQDAQKLIGHLAYY